MSRHLNHTVQVASPQSPAIHDAFLDYVSNIRLQQAQGLRRPPRLSRDIGDLQQLYPHLAHREQKNTKKLSDWESVIQKVETDRSPLSRKRIGPYALGKVLDSGSFSTVRIGIHVLTEEEVAIKVINKEGDSGKNAARRSVEREATALQKLRHVNVISFYEILESANDYYLVLERCGQRLVSLVIARGSLSEHEARFFFKQILDAVTYLHSQGIVHRDLKMDNIMLQRGVLVKVIDFGLSSYLDPGEPRGALTSQCGSPAFTAPEVFARKPYSFVADVWSCGVNLFTMITGKLPFVLTTTQNIMLLHSKMLKGAKIPSGLSEDCRDILKRTLEPDPENRPTAKEVGTHPWLQAEMTLLRRDSSSLPNPYNPSDVTETKEDQSLREAAIRYLVSHCGVLELELREAMRQRRACQSRAALELLVKRLKRGSGFPPPQHLDKPLLGLQKPKPSIDLFFPSVTSEDQILAAFPSKARGETSSQPAVMLPHVARKRKTLHVRLPNMTSAGLMMQRPQLHSPGRTTPLYVGRPVATPRQIDGISLRDLKARPKQSNLLSVTELKVPNNDAEEPLPLYIRTIPEKRPSASFLRRELSNVHDMKKKALSLLMLNRASRLHIMTPPKIDTDNQLQSSSGASLGGNKQEVGSPRAPPNSACSMPKRHASIASRSRSEEGRHASSPRTVKTNKTSVSSGSPQQIIKIPASEAFNL